MFRLFAEYSIILLLISGIVAGIFFYLMDHFRKYVLDGSRDPVRITSLRYLQISVAVLTIALLSLLLAFAGLLGWLNPINNNEFISSPQSTQQPGSEQTVLPNLSQMPPDQGEPISTTTPTLTSPPSPTSEVRAVIGNTGGAGANMRSVPNLQGAIITSVNEGIEVIVMGETETNDGFTWQLIMLPDGRQGWVVNNYLIFQ